MANIDGRTLTELAEAAFWEAAKKVVERARRFGTPIVVMQDGRVVEIPADQFVLKRNPPLPPPAPGFEFPQPNQDAPQQSD